MVTCSTPVLFKILSEIEVFCLRICMKEPVQGKIETELLGVGRCQVYDCRLKASEY